MLRLSLRHQYDLAWQQALRLNLPNKLEIPLFCQHCHWRSLIFVIVFFVIASTYQTFFSLQVPIRALPSAIHIESVFLAKNFSYFNNLTVGIFDQKI